MTNGVGLTPEQEETLARLKASKIPFKQDLGDGTMKDKTNFLVGIDPVLEGDVLEDSS